MKLTVHSVLQPYCLSAVLFFVFFKCKGHRYSVTRHQNKKYDILKICALASRGGIELVI